MTTNKKAMSTWIWILIILIVIGIGIYFWLTSISDENKFPQTIGTFTLVKVNNMPEECRVLGEHPDTMRITRDLGISEQEACTEGVNLEYRSNTTNKIVFINLVEVTQGKEAYIKLLQNVSAIVNSDIKAKGINVVDVGPNIHRLEPAELFWFAQEYDTVITQEAVINGNTYDYSSYATGNNQVTQYFLNKYRPL